MSRNVFFLFFTSSDSQCRVSKGCKVQLLFNLASVFESFLKTFVSAFLLIAPLISHHLLNLSKNLFSVGKDNYLFLLQIYFTFKGYLYIRFPLKVRTFAVIAGAKLTLYTHKPFFKIFLCFFHNEP
jgi:hypothetical protein